MNIEVRSNGKLIVCHAGGSMPDELLVALRVLDAVAMSEKQKQVEYLDMGVMVDSYINEVCPKNFDK